jgi:hypothetical protein
MPQILYTVRTTLPNVQVRGRYLAWLSPNHVLAVKAGGAASARIVLPDRENPDGPATVEVQYVFSSRKALETYLRDHAPALRADALKHFPAENGVSYGRQIAEIATEL